MPEIQAAAEDSFSLGEINIGAASRQIELAGDMHSAVRRAAALAPALTGVEWRVVADAVAREMGRALAADPGWSARPVPRVEFLSVYGRERWSPVPDDGMQRSAAELV